MERLGIDIGGSGIKGAPVDLTSGRLTATRLRIPTPQPATPEAVAQVVAEIVDHFSWSGPIGCGLPAVLQDGIARTAANIDPLWIGTDARHLLSDQTGCDVNVINDADAAGVAEIAYGAGKNRQGTVLLVTVGTGLGTALFHDGCLFPNTELGHLWLEEKIAEKFASATVRKAEGLSYRRWAKRFDLYLHHLQALFWPDLFIIGGGISKKHEKFFPYLTIETEIKPATLANEAGIVGAAATAGRL